MPRRDKTGPGGMGPGTGRGMGPCMAGFGWGRRMMGFGPGLGFGGGAGYGRGFGGWAGPYWGYTPTEEEQRKMLSDYIKYLEEELQGAKDDLRKLTSK